MSLAFNKLKSSLLGYTDKLTLGKFKDCRICDILDDDYEYLIYLEKAGYVKYNNDLIEKLKNMAAYFENIREFEEEISPYLEDVPY